MKFKVLITGGAGFIGSHLVDELVMQGHNVRVIDNLEPQVHGNEQQVPDYLNENIELIRGNICNKEDIKKALEGIDVIFHHAAAVGIGQSMYQIEKYVWTNTYGTARLLDILVNEDCDVKKLVIASSMAIYGEGSYKCDNCGVVYPKLRSLDQLKTREWGMKCPKCGKNVKPIPTDENKPLHPTSIYSMSKRDQEEMCLLIGETYGLPTVALRYFNVYGTRQSLSNPYTGVNAIFSSRILNGNSPVIFEDGNQTRDFVHVNDIVQANILAMNHSKANYETFNVGTGRRLNILELANFLIEIYGSNVTPYVSNRFRKGDIQHCYADITKIKKKLGYEPKVELKDGLIDLTNWVNKHITIDKFDDAKKELERKGLTV